MSWSEKDKQRTYIGELQGLQKQINFLQKSSETKEPSIEKAIDILRNSQDKLYGALAQHDITAEDVYNVIMENADNQLIKEIMQLQKSKDTLREQLTAPKLSLEKSQILEQRLTLKSHQHTAKWDEIINSPNKDELINKIEQAQIKQLQKEQKRDRAQNKNRDYDRSR